MSRTNSDYVSYEQVQHYINEGRRLQAEAVREWSTQTWAKIRGYFRGHGATKEVN